MKIVFDTQGGCWEIQIGVAYKISQKCPDQGIYKTLGQMVRSLDGTSRGIEIKRYRRPKKWSMLDLNFRLTSGLKNPK